MSSNTRMRFRTRQVRVNEVRITGEQAVSLDRILGRGGRRLLHDTLEALPELRKTLTANQADVLNWQKGEGATGRYQLTLRGQALAGLENQGMQEIRINLRLGTAIAEVSHSCQFRTASSVPTTVQQEVQQTVNRTVNQLLAVAVARRVSEQVKQYVGQRLQHEVHMQFTHAIDLQVQQQIQVGVTNQFKFNVQTQAYIAR